MARFEATVVEVGAVWLTSTCSARYLVTVGVVVIFAAVEAPLALKVNVYARKLVKSKMKNIYRYVFEQKSELFCNGHKDDVIILLIIPLFRCHVLVSLRCHFTNKASI